jgi:hypoxanthine phosphoribosyltransferase
MAEVLFTAADIAARIETLADDITPQMTPDTVMAALMSGALLFAADLMRALHRRGIDPAFEALQLESYHDERVSSGRVRVRSDFARSVAGRSVILLDDVFDSGNTLAFAVQHARAQGARDVRSAVLVRKPWPQPRLVTPDWVGFDAPGRFLVGYGMDDAGRTRGCPDIVALD